MKGRMCGWWRPAEISTSRKNEAASPPHRNETRFTASSPPRQVPRWVTPDVPAPSSGPRATSEGSTSHPAAAPRARASSQSGPRM